MKELDKAIVNREIGHIAYLINNNVDCKAAVLIHLKDELLSEGFTEEALCERGAILSLEGLKSAVSGYLNETQINYRTDTYVKRLFSGTSELLKALQEGNMKNKAIEEQFNKQVIDHMINQWKSQKLPEALQNYAEKKQQEYIANQYQAWQEQTLQVNENDKLNKLVQEALEKYWYNSSGDDENAIVFKQIQQNRLKQLLLYYQNENEDNDVVISMTDFFVNRVEEQIIDTSINDANISVLLEQTKIRESKGQIVNDHMPLYKQAMSNLLTKWRAGGLGKKATQDLSIYMKNELGYYSQPGALKAYLTPQSIKQLLMQYKENKLPQPVKEKLDTQFKENITGYYEGKMLKQPEFYETVGQFISKQLVHDWRNQHLEKTVLDYLQTNLLIDLQNMSKALALHTSRFAMASRITQLEKKVDMLLAQLNKGVESIEKNSEVSIVKTGWSRFFQPSTEEQRSVENSSKAEFEEALLDNSNKNNL